MENFEGHYKSNKHGRFTFIKIKKVQTVYRKGKYRNGKAGHEIHSTKRDEDEERGLGQEILSQSFFLKVKERHWEYHYADGDLCSIKDGFLGLLIMIDAFSCSQAAPSKDETKSSNFEFLNDTFQKFSVRYHYSCLKEKNRECLSIYFN